MSFERGIGRHDGDEGLPLEHSVLSPEVAQANLARDLADEMYRTACGERSIYMTLNPLSTLQQVSTAMKLFRERQGDYTPTVCFFPTGAEVRFSMRH